MDPDKLIKCFDHYLALEGQAFTRAMAEQRMLEKLTRSLSEDIEPLLPAGVRFNDDDAIQAFERVWTGLIARFPGDAWKLTDKVLEELRAKKYPGLLADKGDAVHLRSLTISRFRSCDNVKVGLRPA